MPGLESLRPSASLYVHVPFCAHKCEYCAFFSRTPGGQAVERYVGALLREMERLPENPPPPTVFFGGGTPSILTLAQWERILQAMDRHKWRDAKEWTVECNPATISPDKARLLRSYGVNRVSMGVQSLNPELLERLGRVHTRQMVFKSFDILRRAGFDNINLDLMFAIPGQTMRIWRETIAEALALGSEHLSCYEVIYEQDTPLYAQLRAGRLDVDEALACEMYDALADSLAERGFQQYEVANFARLHPGESNPIPARACQHNVNYWRGGAFYGLGPSATGYIGGVRAKNWSNTPLYCELLETGRSPVESQEKLSPLDRAGETAAFGLRMTAGWPFDQFREVTGFDLRDEWAADMRELIDQGLARRDPQRFQLTRRGLRFADLAAQKFLRPESEKTLRDWGLNTRTQSAEKGC
jgi:putative oxygen-independent coproporphyrinogen III oxidase